eukprot:3651284-Rhodomonas_salina.4
MQLDPTTDRSEPVRDVLCSQRFRAATTCTRTTSRSALGRTFPPRALAQDLRLGTISGICWHPAGS